MHRLIVQLIGSLTPVGCHRARLAATLAVGPLGRDKQEVATITFFKKKKQAKKKASAFLSNALLAKRMHEMNDNK